MKSILGHKALMFTLIGATLIVASPQLFSTTKEEGATESKEQIGERGGCGRDGHHGDRRGDHCQNRGGDRHQGRRNDSDKHHHDHDKDKSHHEDKDE